MKLSAQKRKRDDAALALRTSNSSPPPQADQGLALEEVLMMLATGQGEEIGATPLILASISLHMVKVLKEKQEIERKMATMRMSRVQAVHSSEKQKMADLLRCREEENLALKLEMGALRAQVAMLEKVVLRERAHQEQDDSSASSDGSSVGALDSSRDSNSVLESHLVTRMSSALSGYEKGVGIFSNYVHRKWSKRTGKTASRMETLDQLLEKLEVPESTHAAFRLHISSTKKFVWEHWASSAMFNGFEDPSFGLKMAAPLNHDCRVAFGWFLTKKYFEIFPGWLLQDLCRLHDVERDEDGRFDGDIYFFAKFLELAKHVWLLHKLVSSSNPRVTLLRVPYGTAFQATHHFWVRPPFPQPSNTHIVGVMLTPGLCVGKNPIYRSRVLCTE